MSAETHDIRLVVKGEPEAIQALADSVRTLAEEDSSVQVLSDDNTKSTMRFIVTGASKSKGEAFKPQEVHAENPEAAAAEVAADPDKIVVDVKPDVPPRAQAVEIS